MGYNPNFPRAATKHNLWSLLTLWPLSIYDAKKNMKQKSEELDMANSKGQKLKKKRKEKGKKKTFLSLSLSLYKEKSSYLLNRAITGRPWKLSLWIHLSTAKQPNPPDPIRNSRENLPPSAPLYLQNLHFDGFSFARFPFLQTMLNNKIHQYLTNCCPRRRHEVVFMIINRSLLWYTKG